MIKTGHGEMIKTDSDNKQSDKNWKRMWFKNSKVWMQITDDKKPVIKNSKVLIKYNLKQDYQYWIYENTIEEINEEKIKTIKKQKKKKTIKKNNKKIKENIPDNSIIIYTDGASSGNPGPSGIGVVMYYKDKKKKISEYIGHATNNIAELKAIHKGLKIIKLKNIPVRLHTDSGYAYGLLVLGWKPKKNMDLVLSIKQLISEFKDLKFIKVKGHSGDEGNETADTLATDAIKKSPSP